MAVCVAVARERAVPADPEMPGRRRHSQRPVQGPGGQFCQRAGSVRKQAVVKDGDTALARGRLWLLEAVSDPLFFRKQGPG